MSDLTVIEFTYSHWCRSQMRRVYILLKRIYINIQ
jgi:hypothetical protein